MKVWLQEVRGLLSRPDGEQNALYHLAQFLTEKFLDKRFSVLEVHHHTPDAGVHNVEEALEGSGIVVPGFEVHHLQKFVRHWVEIGHWPAPAHVTESFLQAPSVLPPSLVKQMPGSPIGARHGSAWKLPVRRTAIDKPRSESPATVNDQ